MPDRIGPSDGDDIAASLVGGVRQLLAAVLLEAADDLRVKASEAGAA
jgi:hypothetical protein